MKTAKIKRYRLGVSRMFPVTHPRKGEKTYFEDKILKRYSDFNNFLGWQKIHTIRANYPLWEKRMAEIQAGRAVIELFYWAGKPYHKDENGVGQVVFARLDKDSGCGLQKLYFEVGNMYFPSVTVIEHEINKLKRFKGGVELLAKNDGLSLEDFKAWFAKYDLSKDMAIIHFTKFRY